MACADANTSAPAPDVDVTLQDGILVLGSLKEAIRKLRKLAAGTGQEEMVVSVVVLMMEAAEEFITLANDGIADPYAQAQIGYGLQGVFNTLVNDFRNYINGLKAAVDEGMSSFPSNQLSRQPGGIDQQASFICPYCLEENSALVQVRVHEGVVTLNGAQINPTGDFPSINVVVRLIEDNRELLSRCPYCQRQARILLLADPFGPGSNSLTVGIRLTRALDWTPKTQGLMRDVSENLLHVIKDLSKGRISYYETYGLVRSMLITAYLILATAEDGTYRDTAWNREGVNGMSTLLDLGLFLQTYNIAIYPREPIQPASSTPMPRPPTPQMPQPPPPPPMSQPPPPMSNVQYAPDPRGGGCS